MSEEKHINVDQECPDCAGTGLYVGMAERDGIAVQCSRCKGTGKFSFVHTYIPFTGRRDRADVVRVLRCNPGIVAGVRDGLEFGGMAYMDWKMGKPFPPKSEMRRYVCPAWWYQCCDYSKAPQWKRCRECLGKRFAECAHFDNKAECWRQWDAEQEGAR